MDIDTVIEELRAVMKARKGELVDAVAAASKLLRLPRYKVDDSHEVLASDIEAAIARLPADVAKDAKNLLPISHSFELLAPRWKAIKAHEYSGPAKEWRWKSVFGRLAVELLKIQETSPEPLSYRVLSLHLDVTVTYKDSKQHRTTSFEWCIQSSVPDMRWFGFTHNVHDLAVQGWDCESEGHLPVGQVPVRSAGEDGDHWYVVSLGEPIPVGKSVTIKTAMHAEGPCGKFPWLSYTLRHPLEKLSLTANAPRDEATKYTCRELETGEIKRGTDHRRKANATMRYVPSAPCKGRTYRVDWRT